MDLEQTALIADIIQAVAVVTTLLFVGLQVRHNTRIQDWWRKPAIFIASSFQPPVAAEIDALRVNPPPNAHPVHSREGGNPEYIKS